MTPADLRDLAARVVAGTATNEEIALALGWRQEGFRGAPRWMSPENRWLRGNLPAFLSSLDAADLPWMPLRERGWQISVDHEGDDVWGASARIPVADDEEAPEMFEMTRDAAPAEPQARIALALLCMAAEGER